MFSVGTAGEENTAYASRPADFSCRRKRSIPADGDRMSHSDFRSNRGRGRNLSTFAYGLARSADQAYKKAEGFQSEKPFGGVPNMARPSGISACPPDGPCRQRGIICIFGTGRRDVPCASCRRFQKRPLCLRLAGPAYRRAQAVRPAFLPRYR